MSGKTRKLVAVIDFMYGSELKKAEKEFVAAVEDVENLVSRGLAYVRGHEPVPMNSGMPDPINPAKETKRQALVKAHIDDSHDEDSNTGTADDNGKTTHVDPPADPPVDPSVDPDDSNDPPADPPATPADPDGSGNPSATLPTE